MNQVSSSNKAPKTERGRKTRNKLLEAAEIEFGEKGFHDAAISGITHRAGVALGTFYTYFESKEEIFQALVSFMNHRIRRWIAERVSDAPDRLSAERQGIAAYIEFARQHKGIYRIISEAEFVANDAFLPNLLKDTRVAVVQERVELCLVTAALGYGHVVEISGVGGVDDGHLFFDRERLVLILLQDLDEPFLSGRVMAVQDGQLE